MTIVIVTNFISLLPEQGLWELYVKKQSVEYVAYLGSLLNNSGVLKFFGIICFPEFKMLKHTCRFN